MQRCDAGSGPVIGPTIEESTPSWPAPATGRDRPNVVLILLDDVGFGQVGCYGSAVETPNIDALAGDGLRYTNFHATPMCSPTRAALLTGRNHHSVGVGYLADFDTGYPGYRGRVTPEAATLAEMLSDQGYGTYAAGKWHLAPPSDLTAAGPFTHWPTRRGFDRWFGFLWGEDDQWHPELWEDQHQVQTAMPPGRHLSEELTDRSCRYLDDHLTGTPQRPFFLYLAFGACHAPHQAPQHHLDAYRGRFDHGWDEARRQQLQRQQQLGIVPERTTLAPRNPDVPAWDQLTAAEQQQCARLQEAFAGFMTHTDEQIGRLLAHLRARGVDDDTVIILMSDNGASGEGGRIGSSNEYRYFLGLDEDEAPGEPGALDRIGGELAHNHYPSGWAQAGNTPLKHYKKHTYGGGVRVPFILRAPGLDGPGQVRTQFHHVVDVTPTVLDLTGTRCPEQRGGVSQLPLHGTSMRSSLNDPDAASTHRSQYFEMGGHRGMIIDGWKAVAMHRVGAPYDDDVWELFRIDEDVSECHDLAGRHPEVLARLQEAWWQAARDFGVLPLDDRAQARAFAGPPELGRARSRRMLPGGRLMSPAGLDFAARPFTLDASVQQGPEPAEGVLLSYGRRAAGFSLYVRDGRLCFDYNLAGRHTMISTEPGSTAGARRLAVEVDDRDGGAEARLLIDNTTQARSALPGLFPAGFGTFSTQCGHNHPSPVSPDYEAPFRYTAELRHVDIRLGDRVRSQVDAVTQALRQQ